MCGISGIHFNMWLFPATLVVPITDALLLVNYIKLDEHLILYKTCCIGF